MPRSTHFLFALGARFAGLCLLTIGLLTARPLQAAETGAELQWLGGDLPPFVWREQGRAQGYAVELLNALDRKMGRHSTLSFYPWARAVQMAEAGPAYGIFPLTRSAEREGRFNWLIPLGQVRHVFLARTDPSARAPTERTRPLEELREAQVGLLRGSSPIITMLRSKGFTHIYEATDYQELLRLLSQHMIDYVYGGEPMLRASLANSPYSAGDFQFVAALGDATVYMGASAAVSAAEAQKWQQAYEALSKEGEVARLKEKYRLQP